MKKSKILTGLLCVVVCASMLGRVTAADYVGIAVGDFYVWELTDGELTAYAKYEITDITDLLGMEMATGTYSAYDPEADELVVLADAPFTFYYPETIMASLETLGTVTTETKAYGGEDRDCLVIAGVTGYTGSITIDEATGVILEMTFDMVGVSGSFKLVSWVDQDLEAEYGAGGIPGYGLVMLGICAIIPIGFVLRKYRK